MKKTTYESLLDAFRELNSVEDSEVLTTKELEKLREGKEFNLYASSKELEEARLELNKGEEDEIEVIDVNADTLEHVKDKKEYLGQVIVKCCKCHANKFIDMEQLVESDDSKEIYNVEDECPNCRTSGDGFELVGQVAKVAEPEQPALEKEAQPADELDTAQIVNDHKENDSEEASFENNDAKELDEPVSSELAEEEPEAEKAEDAELSFKEAPEKDDLETSEVDDDEDDYQLGAIFDADDVRKDDTIEDDEDAEDDEDDKDEEESEEDDVKEAFKSDDFKPVHKKLKLPTHEALEFARSARMSLTEELLNKFILPESIDRVIVTSGGKNLYDGSIEELPADIIDSKLTGFHVANGFLMCNIDQTVDAVDLPLAKVLNCFTDVDTTKISVWDNNSGAEIFQGPRDAVLDRYGYCQVVSLDAPKTLCLWVKDAPQCTCSDANCVCHSEEEDEATPEDKLCDKIFAGNDMAKYNANDPRSEEFWIAESIYGKEDLPFVYERYVKKLSREIVEEFKAVTGFKDELDEIQEKYNVKLTPVTEQVNQKEEEPTSAPIENKRVRSFKTRKELAESLKVVKDAAIPFKIRRSMSEDYRYDLIVEDTEDDASFDAEDYIKEAEKFAAQIKTFDQAKCERLYFDEYKFDESDPEDEAEQLIKDALFDRIKQLTGKEPEDKEEYNPEEYLDAARDYAQEISNLSLIKAEELYYDDYGFDTHAPVDEAEKVIADALINRIMKITHKKPVIANEALAADFEEEFDEPLMKEAISEADEKQYVDKVRDDISKANNKHAFEYVSGNIDDLTEAGLISEETADKLYKELDSKIDSTKGNPYDPEDLPDEGLSQEELNKYGAGTEFSIKNPYTHATEKYKVLWVKPDHVVIKGGAYDIIQSLDTEDFEEKFFNKRLNEEGSKEKFDTKKYLNSVNPQLRERIKKILETHKFSSEEEADEYIDDLLSEDSSHDSKEDDVDDMHEDINAEFNFDDDEDEDEIDKGSEIAEVIAKAINKAGGIGPFGGEKVILDGNQITLYSQDPKEVYQFNDDGSVDNLSIESMIKTMLKQKLITRSEIEDTRANYSHFDSVKDLLQSDLSWFMYLPEKQILKKVNAILNKKELEESVKMDESYNSTLLLDAVQDAFGFNVKEANEWIRNASEGSKEAIVRGFKEDAKKNFYEDYDENTGDDFKDSIAFLSNDELEAIAGYEEVIEFFKEKGIAGDEVLARLQEMQEDEEEHIEELKELYKAITGEELVEVEPDEDDDVEDDEPVEDVEDEQDEDDAIEEDEDAEDADEDADEDESVGEDEPVEEALEEAAGGNALDMTVEDIAEKHGVDVSDIEKQIKIGVEIEQEHTSDEEQAKKIAMDHLVEFPDYYDRLVKMEKEAEAELGTTTDEPVEDDLVDDESVEDLEDNEDEPVDESVDIRPFFAAVKDTNKPEEEVEFDETSFDRDINKYFDEAYEDTVLYNTSSGSIDKQGNIILEGVLCAENVEKNITFTLTPETAIKESLDMKSFAEEVKKTSFKVTNNLSEEVFVFEPTIEK